MKKTIAFVLILFGVFALQTSAQSFFKDKQVPKDLVVTLVLSSTIQFSNAYELKITNDGKVFYEDRSTLLPHLNFFNVFGLKTVEGKTLETKSEKKNKLKKKLSKKQIKRILGEFEKSGFFEMNKYYEGDPTLAQGTCVNHANTKSITITANGETKQVAFFLGCSYGENSPLKSFLSLFDKISGELKDIQKRNFLERKEND